MSAREKQVAPVSRPNPRRYRPTAFTGRIGFQKMANEFYYPWYPAHYRRDAGHLDHVSDSCYRRLLDAYMEGGEPLKKDPVRLMAIMRVSPEQFSLVWAQLESFFVCTPKGYLHHKRCDIELDRQDLLTKHKSLGGIRSAEKRKSQKEQLNLLIGNSSSTAVQQQFNSSTPKGREGKVIEDIQNHKNGSGAEAPEAPSLKTILFGECLKWLSQKNGGKSPDDYRSVIGKWISRHGEATVLDAFVRAQKGDPQGDPVAYVQSILGASNGKGHNPDEQISPSVAAARILAAARARSSEGNDGEN